MLIKNPTKNGRIAQTEWARYFSTRSTVACSIPFRKTMSKNEFVMPTSIPVLVSLLYQVIRPKVDGY